MDKDLQNLLYLLEDPDEKIGAEIISALAAKGDLYYDKLYDFYLNNDDDLIEDRLEVVLRRIRFEMVSIGFEKWLAKEEYDLLDALLLLPRLEHHDLDEAWIKQRIELILNDIHFTTSLRHTPMEAIHELNNVIFNTHDFEVSSGTDANQFHINSLLSHKTGHPLLISCLYYILSNRSDLPMKAILLPGKMIMGVPTRRKQSQKTATETGFTDDKIAFYVDPTQKGAIYELEYFKKQARKAGVPFRSSDLKASTELGIIVQLLDELRNCYDSLNDHTRAEEIENFLAMI